MRLTRPNLTPSNSLQLLERGLLLSFSLGNMLMQRWLDSSRKRNSVRRVRAGLLRHSWRRLPR